LFFAHSVAADDVALFDGHDQLVPYFLYFLLKFSLDIVPFLIQGVFCASLVELLLERFEFFVQVVNVGKIDSSDWCTS
jgi:hypothetical protein